MKKAIIFVIDSVFAPIYGKKQFQSFFGWLYGIALKGMNLRHRSIDNNGETWVIQYAKACYKSRQVVPVIFDVGANEGQYAQELIQQFGNQMNLHCFEPFPKTFQLLSSRLAASPGIKVHPFGLGDKHAQQVFYVSKYDSTLNSLYPRDAAAAVHYDGQEEIEIRRLSDFCSENTITHIHFLKIDVEGNELNVLKGADEWIASQRIDFIQFEFGSRNVDARTFLSDFFELLGTNYFIYRIVRNGVHPLPKYTHDYEIFAIGNYLAVAKNLKVRFS
jgi:FkbM family methyltransferase